MNRSENRHTPNSVVHVFRSPKGGLFRHVCDLVEGQVRDGLRVGILCDSTGGDEEADRILKQLESRCDLGVVRIPFSRIPSLGDLWVCRALYRHFMSHKPQVIHGHGAKGGTIARLMGRAMGSLAIYTPHGGALHFDSSTLAGSIYLMVERLLRFRTDGVIFESRFAQQAYEEKVGPVRCESSIIYNGLRSEEFETLGAVEQSVDFLFFGELRKLKGLKPLVEAAGKLREEKDFSMIMAGSGPDSEELLQQIRERGLESNIRVVKPIYPAAAAMIKARCVVLPSLAESLPYAVLEALACGKPVITTHVGGIPEIFGDKKDLLIPPSDSEKLYSRMKAFLDDDPIFVKGYPELRRSIGERFSYDRMVSRVSEFYRQVVMQKNVSQVYSMD